MWSGGYSDDRTQAIGGSLTYCLKGLSVRQRWMRFVVSKAQLLEHCRYDLRSLRARLLHHHPVRKAKAIAQLALNGAVDDRRFGAVQIFHDLRTHCASPSHSLSQWKEAYAEACAMHTRKKVDFRVMPAVGRLTTRPNGGALGT